jgi:G patch domain-containing protein 1
LGALNDADDDDLDVYDGDFRKSRTRTAYDASEREGDFRISKGKAEPKSSMVSRLNPFLKILCLDSYVFKRPSSSSNASSTFHNGQRVLDGFVLSDKPVAEDRWYFTLHLFLLWM